MHPALLAAALAFAVAASFFDLRERRIPNALNFAAGALAAAAAVASGAEMIPFALFSLFSFIFAYALYKLGAWAGGDAKFFTALCMLLGVESQALLFVPALFLISVAVSLPFILLGGVVLRKSIPISQLRPGMVPVNSYYRVSGRLVEWEPANPVRIAASALSGSTVLLSPPAGVLVASAARARGLSPAEVTALKKAGVKVLQVRRTVSFAPALAVAFALMAFGVAQWVAAVKLA
ncbi:MAG: prepilin peptidase [Candidatus Micrarchaeota archaeon]